MGPDSLFSRLSFRTKLFWAFWPILLVVLFLSHLVVAVYGFEDNSVWIVLATPLVAALFVFLATRRFTASMESLVTAAEAIGHGEFERRVNIHPNKEFSRLSQAVNSMAERIGREVKGVTEQKEKLEGVLDSMWDGVLVLDRQGRIQSVNRSLAAIIPGVRDKVGRWPIEAVPDREFQNACEMVLTGMERDMHHMEIAIGESHYEVNIVPAAGQDPGFGALAVFHDITSLKHLEAVRKDFVANVSHELRTPLTSIKGYAETLLSDPAPPPETAEKFLGIIRRNADHMAKMVGDLLVLSRLEGGEQKPETRPAGPWLALDTAWEACMALAEAKSVTLDNRLGEHPPKVLADPEHLARVFRNLLENAIRYSPEGSSVAVEMRTEKGMALFTVRDHGPGIPRKDQPRVFERFYSVEKHRTNGSTGLGLAICRHVVRAHHGTIRLESPPAGQDSGAAFHFSFPLA